jgi:hypothetical protein
VSNPNGKSYIALRYSNTHGKTVQGARDNARKARITKVEEIYKKPPVLACCYQAITDVD